MASLASSAKFSSFCELLQQLRRCSQAPERKRAFEKYFNGLQSNINFKSDELLPFLRILLSTMDSERRFDIKHKKLAHRVGKLLSVQASKLLAFDSLSSNSSVERLAEEVSSRVTSKGNGLTVQEVNDRLDKMAQREGRDPDDSDFEYLFQHSSEKELVWIFNVMIRNVESYIGISSSNILSLLDDTAKERWTLCRSLSGVVDDISPSDCILGRNFRPMLLARLPRLTDWWQPIAVNCGKDFFVELKYDGEHVLLHKIDKNNYKYFTRNGKDFSSDYGATSTDGIVSPRIHSHFLDICNDAVLDCELVLWDKEKKTICRHGAKASDGQSYSLRYVKEESDVVIVVVLFDILHYNGRSLLNVPLEERIKVLEKGVLKKQSEDTIYIAKRHVMNTREEVDEFFSQAMKNDEEGIVVKSRKTLYIPGSRARSNGWFKLKPNLSSSCTLDLAVVAILSVQGTHGKDAYLVAARDENSKKMVIVGSVSVGLNDIDRHRIKHDATRYGPLSNTPHESIRGREMEGNGGFIHPDVINVVEVSCTGVRNGKLVDPVVKCIREKDLDEIDSTAEFNELAEVLRNCHLPEEKSGETSKRTKTDMGVIPAKKSKVEEENVLSGKTVCVLQGVDSKLRERAFRILQSFGAKVVANAVEGTKVTIAISSNHPKTRTFLKKPQSSLIHVSWLLRCEEEGRLIPWTEDEILHDAQDGMIIG